MYCRSCGAEVDKAAVACPKCGVPPSKGKRFCQNCKAETTEEQVMCVKCGVQLGSGGGGLASNERFVAAILAICIGTIGIHKFYTGHKKEAIITALVAIIGSFFTFGLAAVAMWILGIFEGVTYLKMSDADFDATYIKGNKGWL